MLKVDIKVIHCDEMIWKIIIMQIVKVKAVLIKSSLSEAYQSKSSKRLINISFSRGFRDFDPLPSRFAYMMEVKIK